MTTAAWGQTFETEAEETQALGMAEIYGVDWCNGAPTMTLKRGVRKRLKQVTASERSLTTISDYR